MRVALTRALDDTELVEVPEPRALGGDALLRVQACSLGWPAMIAFDLQRGAPLVLGRGPVGYITELGPGAHSLRLGARVFVSYHVPYRNADGAPNTVRNPMLHRWTALDPGGFSEFVRIPAEHIQNGAVLELPAQLGSLEACYLEALAPMIEALDEHRLQPGELIVIAGLDLRGLLATQILVQSGLRVLAFDPSPRRRQLAEALGAEPVPECSASALQKSAGGPIPHALFTGGPSSILGILSAALGFRGILTVAGLCDDDAPWPISPAAFFTNMGRIRACYGLSQTALQTALQKIIHREVNLKALPLPLLTLNEVQSGLLRAHNDPDWIGALVLPHGGLQQRPDPNPQ